MNFKGMDVLFSSVSKEGSVGPRTGFFHHFAQREIIAKRFDPKEEVFVSDVSNEDIERFRLDLQNLDKNLGKYRHRKSYKLEFCTVSNSVVKKYVKKCVRKSQ